MDKESILKRIRELQTELSTTTNGPKTLSIIRELDSLDKKLKSIKI